MNEVETNDGPTLGSDTGRDMREHAVVLVALESVGDDKGPSGRFSRSGNVADEGALSFRMTHDEVAR
jgi:hypothetical protein